MCHYDSHSYKYSTIKTNYTRAHPEILLQSSEDAGHRDQQNVQKNNLQNMAKEPEKPTTTTIFIYYLFIYLEGLDSIPLGNGLEGSTNVNRETNNEH